MFELMKCPCRPPSSVIVLWIITSKLSNFSLLVWNVQDVGHRDFLLALKELLRNYKPAILVLLETIIRGTELMKCVKILVIFSSDVMCLFWILNGLGKFV